MPAGGVGDGGEGLDGGDREHRCVLQEVVPEAAKAVGADHGRVAQRPVCFALRLRHPLAVPYYEVRGLPLAVPQRGCLCVHHNNSTYPCCHHLIAYQARDADTQQRGSKAKQPQRASLATIEQLQGTNGGALIEDVEEQCRCAREAHKALHVAYKGLRAVGEERLPHAELPQAHSVEDSNVQYDEGKEDAQVPDNHPRRLGPCNADLCGVQRKRVVAAVAVDLALLRRHQQAACKACCARTQECGGASAVDRITQSRTSCSLVCVGLSCSQGGCVACMRRK